MNAERLNNKLKSKSKKGKSNKELKTKIKKLRRKISKLKDQSVDPIQSSNTSQNKGNLTLNFKKIMKIIKKETEKFKKLKFENQKKIENELEGIEASENDTKLIKMIQELSTDQKYKLSTKDLNKIAKEKKMKKNQKHEFVCLHEYDNVNLVPNRSEWENEMYNGSKNGIDYIIKTRKLKPMTIFEQKLLEKELRLSKLASDKRIGPIINDIFYCRDKFNRVKIYIVYQKINSGSLKDWIENNKLTEKHKKQIKKLINKLYQNNIIPGYIGDNNILVKTNPQNKDKIQFYFSRFKHSSSLDDLIEQKKEESSADLDWLGSYNTEKISQTVATYLVKKKLIKAIF